jgi:hypothetical protein
MGGVSIHLCAQSYHVHGADGYTKPKYLLFTAVSSDHANASNHFLGAFQRAGFEVVNSKWANAQVNNQNNLILVAEQIEKLGQEISQADLKSGLRENGLIWLNGGKGALNTLISSGHVLIREQEVEGKRGNTKIENYYSWSGHHELPDRKLSEANTFHLLSYNYTYRESLSCGKTFVEIHGSVVDVSGELNEQQIDFSFTQPSLSSTCPQRVVNELVRRMTSDMRTEAAEERLVVSSDITFRKNENNDELNSVQSLLIMPKPGKDCMGVSGTDLEDIFALSLLESYDIVDRSITYAILDEHKLNMNDLFKDSDFIEAGQLAGAEAILTLQPACLNETNIIKVKMISVNSSLLLWSLIAKNQDRTPEVEEIMFEISSKL